MMIKDIAAYLADQGFGVFDESGPTSTIFAGWLPDSPDDAIIVGQYAGRPPDLEWNGEYPGLQVRVRNWDDEVARTTAQAIFVALHGQAELVLAGTRYLLIRASGSPESIGKDERGRPEWVVNFSVIKEF